MSKVFDRLAAALGQDIFECLFSDETLERDSDGRSKVLRPLGMFLLALMYNVAHAAALFAQVVTLNVAVNSYSNALVTLLLSNQFVEVKGTVFKKFEKDNLFQLTCADVVERFQLWLMLMIIAMRNVVEMGGFSSMVSSASEAASSAAKNSTIPLRTNSILPNAFTLLPGWSGEVLSPFLIVIGSEMLVDWIKHAYISKFNGVKPAIYQRFLDVLAKDYYTNVSLPLIVYSLILIKIGLCESKPRQTSWSASDTPFVSLHSSCISDLSYVSRHTSTTATTIYRNISFRRVFSRYDCGS
jgi:hypothetical protein